MTAPTLKGTLVTWRDGRPRFNPGPRERKLGFAGEDLRHSDGRWFTFEEAELWGRTRLDEIKRVRASGRPRPKDPATDAKTVTNLIRDWLAALEARVGDPDPDARVSPDTVRSYRGTAAALLWKPESRGAAKARRAKMRAAELLGAAPPVRELEAFGQASVAAIDEVVLNEHYDYMKKTRGPYMAKAAVAAFSAAYTWGKLDRRWRLDPRKNPRKELELPSGKGRIVVWSDTELNAMITAAAELGRPSIGDSIVLAIYTAQRQRDRLELEDGGLIDGRRHFRQSKTDVLVPVREVPDLAARLAAARLRVTALMLKYGTRPNTILVDETTGRPWVQDTYRRVFGEVRALAAARCASLAGKRDGDLRDTAVTWLARAGSSLLQICMVSGHSPQSVQTIMRHYLGAAPELGDQAIGLLVDWMKREGMSLTGSTKLKAG